MRKKYLSYYIFASLLCLFLSACSSVSGSTPAHDKNEPVRDNTPQVLVPSAPGTETFQEASASIDYSNRAEGYIMANYNGSSNAKIQITDPAQNTYTYVLFNDYNAFPLTGGNGTYNIKALENVSGDSYSVLISQDISVEITNEFGPYLYPSQYVNFSEDAKVVSLGSDLAKETYNDLEVVSNVYNYIVDNITYDTAKAQTVESGYVPDCDAILESKTGICFDYAAVMASMLRSQGIPTRMEFGYAGEAYHAWVSVYSAEKGWINGIIEFDGKNWELMDPTLAASGQSNSQIKEFIGDGSKYVTKYVY